MNTEFLSVCDYCCDEIGLLKEVFKSGGCICEICGWHGACALGTREHFVNKVHVSWIKDWEAAEQCKHRYDRKDLRWN